MKILKLIVGLSLLFATVGCTAYVDDGYYARPHYYRYYSYY